MKTLIVLIIKASWMILIALALIGLLAWIFWPKKGLIAFISKRKLNDERVLLEDALKYLFECEYRKSSCEMNSLAGALNISGDRVSKLIQYLQGMGLINMNNNSISLTDSGRSYSLRVIRVHRIWERYLADETGTAQPDWHEKACEIEHFVTDADTEKIAAQMGNPVFDPHGDPIPTAEGELPESKGKSLSTLQEGEIGRIIHIEDEPRSIYEQLVVLGLYPGMQVYVTDVTADKITFAANGDECTLTPLFATHITVEPLSSKTRVTQKQDILSELKVGEKAEVIGISPNCRGQQRRRLMDMGIVPGSLITAQMISASGDPIGYRVMGTTVGIRRQQADLIFINKNINHE